MHHLSMVSWAESSAIILFINARHHPTEVRSLILICHYNETESTMSLHIYNFTILDGVALEWQIFEKYRFEKWEKNQLKLPRSLQHSARILDASVYIHYVPMSTCILVLRKRQEKSGYEKKRYGNKKDTLRGVSFFLPYLFFIRTVTRKRPW